MIKNALVIAATVPLAFMLHSCSMTANSPVQTIQNTDIEHFFQPNLVSSCDLDHSEIPHLPPDIFEHVNALCDVKLLAAGSDLVGLGGNVATTEKSTPVRAALTSQGQADILKMVEPVRREKPND